MTNVHLSAESNAAGGSRNLRGKRCLVATMRSMIKGSGKAFTDISTARNWLAASPLSNGRTGVIGFVWAADLPC